MLWGIKIGPILFALLCLIGLIPLSHWFLITDIEVVNRVGPVRCILYYTLIFVYRSFSCCVNKIIKFAFMRLEFLGNVFVKRHWIFIFYIKSTGTVPTK